MKQQFFDSVRVSIFNGTLTQGVVDSLNAILNSCVKNGVTKDEQVAYILATARHESYNKDANPQWLPVREGWVNSNSAAIKYVTSLYNAKKISKNYALPNAKGLSYYGRGFAQTTFEANYLKMGKRLGIDLVNNPDLAMDRKISADLLVIGSKEGLYTGVGLSRYFNDKGNDPIGARAIINGKDAAERIKGFYDKFLVAIKSSK